LTCSKKQFGGLKASYEAQSGILGQMREQTNDLMSAQMSYRKAVDNKIKLMIDQVGTKLGTPQQQLAMMKGQIDQAAMEREAKFKTTLMGNLTSTLHADADLHTKKADLISRYTQALEAIGAKSTPNRMQANKLADTDNALSRIEQLKLRAKESPDGKVHMDPAEQADLSELFATARSNSGTGPKNADREVAQKVVSGTLPSPKALGVHIPIRELYTKYNGLTVEELNRMAEELKRKQTVRNEGRGGSDFGDTQ
jgi:hypothetical protein